MTEMLRHKSCVMSSSFLWSGQQRRSHEVRTGDCSTRGELRRRMLISKWWIRARYCYSRQLRRPESSSGYVRLQTVW